MKKIICLLLMTAMLTTSLVSCSMDGSTNDGTNTGDAAGTTTASTDAGTNAGGEGDAQPEGTVSERSLSEIAETIKSADFEYPSMMEMPLEDAEFFKTNFGIDRPEGMKEALLVMPAISSIACSIGLIRMENEDDARMVAQEIEGSLDTHQWICAQPSFVKAIARGNTVLLIVEGDDARGQAMVDAFEAL